MKLTKEKLLKEIQSNERTVQTLLAGKDYFNAGIIEEHIVELEYLLEHYDWEEE